MRIVSNSSMCSWPLSFIPVLSLSSYVWPWSLNSHWRERVQSCPHDFLEKQIENIFSQHNKIL